MNKILIVDDAAFMRSVIRGILEKGGYDDFCEAEDGDVAFSRYREYAPYLTILDITMPRQDGIETLRQIIGFDAAARVVMCSAIGQEPQIVKDINLGAKDYIVKPFRPDNMLRVVDRYLREGGDA